MLHFIDVENRSLMIIICLCHCISGPIFFLLTLWDGKKTKFKFKFWMIGHRPACHSIDQTPVVDDASPYHMRAICNPYLPNQTTFISVLIISGAAEPAWPRYHHSHIPLISEMRYLRFTDYRYRITLRQCSKRFSLSCLQQFKHSRLLRVPPLMPTVGNEERGTI